MTEYTLRGERLTARFQAANGSLRVAGVEDRRTGARLDPGEAFSLVFRDGSVVTASQMKLSAAPVQTSVAAKPAASRAAERIAGNEVCADLSRGALAVHWCAILRDGTNYVRQEVTLKAEGEPVDLAEVRMFDFAAPEAQVVGSVPGSPLVDGNFFFGFEFPLSASSVEDGRAASLLKRTLPLEAGNSVTYSSVIGVAAPGQMRRDFLRYVELERAHPYRTFLHYNSWYDIGYGERYDEAEALDRVHAFGEELVRKRGVTMDSFLFDDGWDDTHTLWGFNPGLPDGFTKIHEAAAKYGFGIGVWLSPWGGYSDAKKQRIVAGEAAGYETVKGGFALSAPKYYGLFEHTCLEMISKYGVNQFKFDGTGNASQVFPGSIFDSDFSAAIHLIERLREQEPNIFINLTTGTRPSPFWLRYADSIWRSGDDHSFDGVGSWRQKWITYRDEQTYRNIVEGGPLYPLNSLMLHGLIFAKEALHLDTDPNADFIDEVHDYFGSGTQLQEMYITPSLLTKEDWDALAESARWSRRNAAVLKDTHWIGGDPGKLEAYGWASWTPEKGIVVLRNPSDREQEFLLDVGKAFELPEGAARSYRAHSPWASDKGQASIRLRAGETQKIVLKPFEVLTLDAEAVK
ncbi:MAG: enterotoxin [Terracidiphilus sp.]